VRQAHAILHKALEQAVRWGELPHNVADLVDPPRLRRRPMTAYGPDEAARLLQAAKGDPLEALYVLALTTGMRQGELLALRWRDVDLDGGRLAVRATLLRTPAGVGLAEPKTAASTREVELSSIAVDALQRHHAAQSEARLQAGSEWDDGDFVFTNAVGRPINASNLLTRSWHPLLRRSGLQRVRFHDLRHTAATLLLGRGVHPKVVSEMLGHSTIAITLDLYSHVTKTMGQMAAKEMDALFAQS
jgi:integrase